MKKGYLSHIEKGIYILFAAFCFWLAAQIPYTHDDWDWGLPVGIQQLLTANLNSRYAGNFLEVVMTRSELWKTLIMGMGFFLLPFLITRVAFDHNEEQRGRIFCFLMSAGVFLAMDRWIWQQTCGWIAGYANFGISAIFMLLILHKCLTVFTDQEQPKRKNGYYIMLFALSFVAQLFLENIAIYLFLAASFTVLLDLVKTRKLSKEYLMIAVGTAIGLLLIFSSNIYETLWDTGSAVDGYRQLHVNANAGFGAFVKTCLDQANKLVYHIWEDNLVSCLVILMLLTALLLRRSPKRLPTVLGLFANIGWFVYFLTNHMYHYLLLDSPRSILGLLFFVSVCGELVLLFSEERSVLCQLLAVWVSTGLVILPLVVTSETGVRLFFSANILMILFAAMLLRQLVDMGWMPICGIVTGLLCLLLLVLVMGHGKIYSEIGRCKRQRDAVIVQAVEQNADSVLLPQYPYGNYLWIPNPDSEKRIVFFKEFYGIPEKMTVVFE